MSDAPKYPDARPEMQEMFKDRWERLHLPTPLEATLDSRQNFITGFLRMKRHTATAFPTTWPEMADWLTEFDRLRNEYNIEFEKMFREHMETWAIVITGEGATARLATDSNLRDELHNAWCVCGEKWESCKTEGIAEDIRRLDDDEEWLNDEDGQRFGMEWSCETGNIAVYKLAGTQPAPPPERPVLNLPTEILNAAHQAAQSTGVGKYEQTEAILFALRPYLHSPAAPPLQRIGAEQVREIARSHHWNGYTLCTCRNEKWDTNANSRYEFENKQKTAYAEHLISLALAVVPDKEGKP